MAAARGIGNGNPSNYFPGERNIEWVGRSVFSLCTGGSATGIAVATHNFKVKMKEAGRLTFGSFYCEDLNGGTITIDVLKNGASVLSATFTLSADTVKTLEGFGATGVTAGYWATDTAANKAKIKYERGDTFTLQLVVATAVVKNVAIRIDATEQCSINR